MGRNIGIQVLSEDELIEQLVRGKKPFTHCISIRDSFEKRPFQIEQAYPRSNLLELKFYNIEHAKKAKADEIRLSHIKQLIDFYNATIAKSNGYTIHCRRGIARSTAVALCIMYLITKSEEKAKEYLLRIRPMAQPLKRITRLFDAIMKSSLTEAAKEIRGETPLIRNRTSGAANLDESVRLFMQKQRRIKGGFNR